jgi:hypothetical protein
MPKQIAVLLPVYVAVDAATYLLMLWILKAIAPEDVDLMRQYLGPRLGVAANLMESVIAPTIGPRRGGKPPP